MTAWTQIVKEATWQSCEKHEENGARQLHARSDVLGVSVFHRPAHLHSQIVSRLSLDKFLMEVSTLVRRSLLVIEGHKGI